MDELKLKAFELAMDIARLPKPYSPGNAIAQYASSPQADSIDVILTRAGMIEKYLSS